MINVMLRFIGAPAASLAFNKEHWPTIVATFISILLLTLVSSWLTPIPQTLFLVASMGASAILVFVIPNSPLTQPYALVMGHIAPAFIGVSFAYLAALYTINFPLTAALCISASLLVMYLFNCLHPPGGAAALMPIILGPEMVNGYNFIIFPVFINTLCLLLLGVLFHRYWLTNEYPSKPMPKEDPLHHHKDLSPLSRLGIKAEDLTAALESNNKYLNITEKDLTEVYAAAQQKSYTRKFGEIHCSDIMSQDVKTVNFNTDLEEAWALLRLHKVKLLPVIDDNNHVIGIISLVDYLKRANLKTYNGFSERLINFVKQNSKIDDKHKPTHVGQIMASPAFTVQHDDLIASLVPLLSDKGLHHIPVTDGNQQLVGIITQSDLIAALYAGSIGDEGDKE